MSKQSDLVSVSQGASGDPLFIDTVNDRVGVGTSSPNLNTIGTVLHVNNGNVAHAALTRYTTGDTGSAATDGFDVGMWSDGDAFVWMRESANMRFATAGTERMRIDAAGRVTKPFQVAFMAYKTGSDEFFGVGETLKYNATLFNIGNAYNTSTYTFTAPIAGRYLFSITANGANDQKSTGGVPRAYWKINGADVAGSLHLRGTEVGTTGSLEQRSSTVMFQLNANDTVKMVVGQNTFDIFAANHFMGYLLG